MSSRLMTIGHLSRKTGVTSRAIRHYERLGLMKAPSRSSANYRLFDDGRVARLKLIAGCRSLGFSIPEIADLLHIMEDPTHRCARIARLARQHLDLVDAKIQTLMEMRRTLADHLAQCSETDVPACAVLDFLQEPASARASRVRFNS